MTTIKIIKKNKDIVGFEISGHTGYSKNGEDIVCSAISAISQSACLGIVKVLNLKAIINKNDSKDYLMLALPKNINREDLDKAQIILKTMQFSLSDLLTDYGKYIKMEVQDEIY